MFKNIITLVLLLFITSSCSKDDELDSFKGEYHLVKTTSAKPVKYYPNSTLTNNLTEIIPCDSYLIFEENNKVKEDFISYDISSYQITLNVGVTDFSPTNCHISRVNGILKQNNENNLKVEFSPNVELWTIYKDSDTLKVITYASLVYLDDDGYLKKGNVELTYRYLK